MRCGARSLLGVTCALLTAANAPVYADAPASTESAAEDPWAIVAPSIEPPATLTRSVGRGAGTGSTSGGWLRTAGSLAVVVAAILLLFWGHRALTSGKWSRGAGATRSSAIQILGRTALSSRHSVHLLRVGTRTILVGVSPDRICHLDTLPGDAGALAAGQALRSESAEQFQAELEREAATYAPSSDASTDEFSLPAVRRRLLGAVQRIRNVNRG